MLKHFGVKFSNSVIWMKMMSSSWLRSLVCVFLIPCVSSWSFMCLPDSSFIISHQNTKLLNFFSLLQIPHRFSNNKRCLINDVIGQLWRHYPLTAKSRSQAPTSVRIAVLPLVDAIVGLILSPDFLSNLFFDFFFSFFTKEPLKVLLMNRKMSSTQLLMKISTTQQKVCF